MNKLCRCGSPLMTQEKDEAKVYVWNNTCPNCGLDILKTGYTKIVNLTPHAINFLTDDSIIVFPPSGVVARVEEYSETVGHVNGFPITGNVHSSVQDLPLYKDGVMYIVSSIVLDSATTRTDLLSPTVFLRDASGRIIGAKAFKQNQVEEAPEYLKIKGYTLMDIEKHCTCSEEYCGCSYSSFGKVYVKEGFELPKGLRENWSRYMDPDDAFTIEGAIINLDEAFGKDSVIPCEDIEDAVFEGRVEEVKDYV